MSTREPKEKGKAPHWGVWAAIVAAAVILGGIGLVFLLGMPDKDDTGETPPSTSEPTTPTSEPSTDKCDVPGGDITAVPTDLEWDAADGITWPVSPSLGPTSSEDGWPVCFSHSPVGVALAASTVLLGTLGRDQAEIIEFFVADSPGKPVALSEAGTSADVAQSIKDKGLQIAGFRVDEYEADRASVTLVFSQPNAQTGFVGLEYTFVWVDNDWRMRVLDDGSAGAGQAIPVNDGQFTKWTSNG